MNDKIVSGTPTVLTGLFAASGVYKPEDTIGFLLWRVAHRHQREVDRVLAPLDLTHLQFVLLVQTAWLGRLGEPVTQPGLARYGGIHPMQLSSVLKTLEAKDLVVRGYCPGDSRAKQVVLTPAAIDLLGVALPKVTALQAHFFGDDPAFGADLQARLRHVVTAWGEGG